MHNIRAICLDLDNTLWDIDPVIMRAERKVYAWYRDNYPLVTQKFSLAQLVDVRQQIIGRMPELVHDLTALRLAALKFIAEEAGYAPDTVEEIAHQAFAVFQRERNIVTLYADVLVGLEALAQTHELFSLSNGNADLQVIGIAHFFKYSFTAREIGKAKPDLAVYAAVCRESGLRPEQILHVGDNPVNDIVAAAQAGLPTVWVNRTAAEWTHATHQPDHIATDLHDLVRLFDHE